MKLRHDFPRGFGLDSRTGNRAWHLRRYAIGLALTLRAAVGSAEECTPVNQVNGDEYEYAICGVPDLDQIRATWPGVTWGLPNSGMAHCVPTSAMNFFAYIANTGHPELSPGPADWESSSRELYDFMTERLELLGTYMGTDAFGTNAEDSRLGIMQWLRENGLAGRYIVDLDFGTDVYSPVTRQLAKAALGGSLVLPSIGWFQRPNGKNFLVRHGGHTVALVGARRRWFHFPGFQYLEETVTFHDPSSSDSLIAQSAYSRDTYVTADVEDIFGLGGSWDWLFASLKTQSRVLYYSDGYIDGYQAIRAAHAWATGVDGSLMHLVPLDQNLADPSPIRTYSPDAAVTALLVGPQGFDPWYLADGQNAIFQLDPVTGQSAVFAQLDRPKRLAFGGPEMSLYVLLDGMIVSLDQQGRSRDRVLLEEPVEEITFNEQNDRLLAVSLRTRQILEFDPSLRLVDSIDLPDVPGDSDEFDVSVDPGTGHVWLLRHGSNRALLYTPEDCTAKFYEVEFVGAGPLESLSAGDEGLVYLSDGNSVSVYDSTGQPVGSPFNGLPAGPRLSMARSFTNFDPALHTGPGYQDVPPPGF